ncbi:alpha/beta fold hydrolase [Empedobacter falsenii]|uniref:alpha/beta fold hydrolase n=2 Tax=Empedobacter falsenii TaxID=343874 RepID=UPI002575054B|nr:alpha/beta fold hydrolase [Empedobacter falsenii]MDM1298571.1 alpha/beta fold hydrolase [Empedobacter falsenii]MDM1318364.1 alpha/beta fold hydrolase [Empedobacter falsenii]
MRNYFFMLIVTICTILQAQIKLKGSVKDSNNLPISYCSIGIKNSEVGAITDENGQFSIEIPENLSKSQLIFDASGYDDISKSIEEIQQNSIVILSEKSISLTEVTLKTEKMKEKIIGQKTRPMLTFSKMFNENVPTIEQGNIFEIYPNTKLSAFNFHIIPSSKYEEITLKVNIYAIKNGLPTESLLDENIIYKTSTTGWQKIDLTPYKFRFKNVKQIAVTVQLVDYKKLAQEDFVFGISAKKSLGKDLLFRYQSQGNWEASAGIFIANLDILYSKDKLTINEEKPEEIDAKTKELISYYQHKESAKKSIYGKNKSGKYIDINDAKIYYEEYGQGEPLIFLHGNNGSIEDFYQQIPLFAKHYRVIVLDTRGQGRSTDLTNTPYTYEEFANDLLQIIQKLNLKKVNLVGWSDGGNTALIFNAQHPELVNKIVTIGAVLNPNGVSEELIRSLKSLANKPSENTNLRLIELMLNEPNITKSELNKIQNPVLVIAGEKDEVKESHTKEIQQNISKAELLIIPNSTHYVPFEQPKVLNEAILKFLKK